MTDPNEAAGQEFGRALDAELAALDLADTGLTALLRAAALREIGSGASARTLPPDAAARVCAAVLREVSSMPAAAPEETGRQEAAKFAELAELQRQLAQAARDPSNVERHSFRDLLRAFRAGGSSR